MPNQPFSRIALHRTRRVYDNHACLAWYPRDAGCILLRLKHFLSRERMRCEEHRHRFPDGGEAFKGVSLLIFLNDKCRADACRQKADKNHHKKSKRKFSLNRSHERNLVSPVGLHAELYEMCVQSPIGKCKKSVNRMCAYAGRAQTNQSIKWRRNTKTRYVACLIVLSLRLPTVRGCRQYYRLAAPCGTYSRSKPPRMRMPRRIWSSSAKEYERRILRCPSPLK